MFTLVGFAETIDPAGVDVNLTALADQHVTTTGDDLTIPALNQIVALAAGVASGGTAKARLDIPSLLRVTRVYVSPINGYADADATPEIVPNVMDYRQNPLVLRPSEIAQAVINSDTTAAALQWLLMWLADGPIRPVTGEMFTNRFTGTTTLVVDVWTNGTITPDDRLPAGRYAVVGMRAISAGIVAARLVFPGEQGYRPGVLGALLDDNHDWPGFRFGGMGIFGEFEHNQIPSVEYLSSVADTAEEVYLDLIKVR